jgi:hypothetical protein
LIELRKYRTTMITTMPVNDSPIRSLRAPGSGTLLWRITPQHAKGYGISWKNGVSRKMPR